MENYPVFPSRLKIFLKMMTLECQNYLSRGMWVMDMKDEKQLSHFPRALPTNGYRGVYRMWEMRDVLENENY